MRGMVVLCSLLVLLGRVAAAQDLALEDLLHDYAGLLRARAEAPQTEEVLNRAFMDRTFKKVYRVEGAEFLYLSKHERNRFPAQAEFGYVFWMRSNDPGNIMGGVDRFFRLPEQVVPYPVYIVLSRAFDAFPWPAHAQFKERRGTPFRVDLQLYVPWMLGTPVKRMEAGSRYALTFTLYRAAERRSLDHLGLTGAIETVDDPSLTAKRSGGSADGQRGER